MTRSAMQDNKRCYLCSKQFGLERHHCIPGIANRKLSEKYGLWVWLCQSCHTGTDGAQYDKELSIRLKREAQEAFENSHTREEFMAIFGKNYLD